MSLLAVQGGATGTGTVTLLAPVTNTDRTLTLPDATGTVLSTATAGVPVNGPAFSAYANASQTVSSNTHTKIALTVEDFDTNSNFDSTTNYRFTPTVAGYYQLNAKFYLAGTVSTAQIVLQVYKNGSAYERFIDSNPSATLSVNGYIITGASTLMYMNGSTDYVELYGYYFGGTSTFNTTGATTTSRFSGSMVRSAT